MTTELSLPKGFGAVSSVFRGNAGNDELGAGIASSYGIIGYRGKVWSTKYQGKETQLLRDDGDGPRGSIEVVIIKSATAVSKIFYKGGYVDGANSAPDCWSTNGVTPDSAAQNKQHPTCAACPMNAWGSRVTEAGKQGKACSDSRRITVVPLNDIDNEAMGGPMLMRIPAASLKDLKAYGDLLNSYQYPYYGVATRIAFDPKEAYPKFVFTAMRPLSDDEAKKIVALRDDKRVSQVLNESQEFKPSGPEQAEEAAPAASPFEQPAPKAEPKAAPKAEAKKAAPVTQKVTPKPEPVAEETESAPAPSSFDDMLEDIL
jgi:hypothetical protein